MTKGKIIAQVCHAISDLYSRKDQLNPDSFATWKRRGEAKIVLKSSFDKMMEILVDVEKFNSKSLTEQNDFNERTDTSSNENEFIHTGKATDVEKIPVYRIHDAGRTQVPAGSMTVIALGPAEKKTLSKYVSELKMF